MRACVMVMAQTGRGGLTMTAFSRMCSTTSQRARRARAKRSLLRAAVWAAASLRRMLAMVARTGTASLWCFACRNAV